MTVSSQSLEAGTVVPVAQQHSSCSGTNRSPHVGWNGSVSSEVKSYAVSFVNKGDSNRIHWLVYDIPLTENSLAAALSSAPAGATIGPTDYGAAGYRGPCITAGALQTMELKVWAVTVTHLSEVSGINLADPSSILSGIERKTAAFGTLQVILTQ